MEIGVCRKEGGPEDRLDPSNSSLFRSKAGSIHAQDPGKLSPEQCAMELWDTSTPAHTCPVHQRHSETRPQPTSRDSPSEQSRSQSPRSLQPLVNSYA